jgi:nucleoside-diphosphate-sugar epimerase
MQVLVTGHRGYIGSVLVPQLVVAGHRVTGLDCDLYRACDFGGARVPEPGIVKDVRDVTPGDLQGFDAVVHLAGLSNDPLGNLDPALTQEINTAATLRLAAAAKAAGVSRFVFSSSCSNYGAAASGEWLTEESPLNPVTPYAVSKVECEAGLDRLADDGFTTVYLRSATAYGMSPRIRFDLVANNLTAWAVATGQVMLKSDGSAWRPLVHAEDMAQAFVVALEADRAAVHRQAFNVGRNEDCMQIRDLAGIVRELIPEASIGFTPGPIVDKRTYRVDCSKIRSIGFEPAWSVRKGIAQLRDAFRTHGVRVEDFEGERYQRVAHIRSLMSAGLLDGTLRPREEIAA